jgi:hypothetical protein
VKANRVHMYCHILGKLASTTSGSLLFQLFDKSFLRNYLWHISSKHQVECQMIPKLAFDWIGIFAQLVRWILLVSKSKCVIIYFLVSFYLKRDIFEYIEIKNDVSQFNFKLTVLSVSIFSPYSHPQHNFFFPSPKSIFFPFSKKKIHHLT